MPPARTTRATPTTPPSSPGGEDSPSGRAKPAPDLYIVAAEKLGVPAQNCIAYEDTPEGRRAALDAGMRCIDVRPFL